MCIEHQNCTIIPAGQLYIPAHIPELSSYLCQKNPLPENGYVHGYSARESERLADQAQTLTELLHHDTHYPAGSRVLEAGCGIGAQTVILAQNSPDALITSVDISEDSLRRAEEKIRQEGITNVTFRQGDIFHLPFGPESFDHIFVCFVLEHLADPQRALGQLRPLLKEGGTITVIEGDHGSTILPSREHGCPPGNRLPRGTPAQGWRQCPYRPAALPARNRCRIP